MVNAVELTEGWFFRIEFIADNGDIVTKRYFTPQNLGIDRELGKFATELTDDLGISGVDILEFYYCRIENFIRGSI